MQPKVPSLEREPGCYSRITVCLFPASNWGSGNASYADRDVFSGDWRSYLLSITSEIFEGILGNGPAGEKDPSIGKGRVSNPVVIPKRAIKNLDECSDVGNPHGGSALLLRNPRFFQSRFGGKTSRRTGEVG